MAGIEPGDRPGPSSERQGRQLERAPGERYARSDPRGGGPEPRGAVGRGSLVAPLAKGVLVAIVGALSLYALGALLSSSVGLVFVAGLTGAAVGLLLARAAAPGGGREAALSRRHVTWAAVGLTVLAVVLGGLGTWLHAIAEGGALGPVDYLVETFGAIVPLELAIGAIAAAWGAGAGPVER